MSETQQQPTQAAALEAIEPQRPTLKLLDLVIEAGVREDYAKNLIDAEINRDLFNQDWRLAKVFAASRQFSDIAGVTEEAAIATAMAKIQIGRSWGLTPGDSMQFIFFTNGKPSVQNEIIASKMRQAGFDWDIDWLKAGDAKGRQVCIGCTLWLKRKDAAGDYMAILDRNGAEVSISFTKAEADNATIWEKGKQIPLSQKWNYQSWPQDMYFWRCIARAKRWHATDVLRGAMTPDEAEDAEPGATLHRMASPGSAKAALMVAHTKIETAIAKDPALKSVLAPAEHKPAAAEPEPSTRRAFDIKANTFKELPVAPVVAGEPETDAPAASQPKPTFQATDDDLPTVMQGAAETEDGLQGPGEPPELTEEEMRTQTATAERLERARETIRQDQKAAGKLVFGKGPRR